MPGRRLSQIELNFDGLTDSVTNLVGTLILLVVLVMAVSREAGSASKRDSAYETTAHAHGDGKSLDDLIARLERLRNEADSLDKEVAQLEDDRLPELRRRVVELTNAVRSKTEKDSR